jgi:hypothetical protein
MAGSTAKKVVVRRFDRETLTGFVNPFSYLQPQAPSSCCGRTARSR